VENFLWKTGEAAILCSDYSKIPDSTGAQDKRLPSPTLAHPLDAQIEITSDQAAKPWSANNSVLLTQAVENIGGFSSVDDFVAVPALGRYERANVLAVL